MASFRCETGTDRRNCAPRGAGARARRLSRRCRRVAAPLRLRCHRIAPSPPSTQRSPRVAPDSWSLFHRPQRDHPNLTHRLGNSTVHTSTLRPSAWCALSPEVGVDHVEARIDAYGTQPRRRFEQSRRGLLGQDPETRDLGSRRRTVASAFHSKLDTIDHVISPWARISRHTWRSTPGSSFRC